VLKYVNVPAWLRSTTPDTLLRLLVAITATAVAIAAAVVFDYLIQFGLTASHDQAVWGQFGDFIGGTLNPLFGFLTLIALLLTLVIQSNELRISTDQQKRSADAAQKQIEFHQRESRRADLYRLIEKLTGRINRNFNENRLDEGHSMHGVLADKDMIHPRLDTSTFYKFYHQEGSLTRRTVGWIEADLTMLREYLTQYEQVSDFGFGETPLAEFFRHEYGEMISLLNQYGMIKADIYEYFVKSSVVN